MSLADLFRVRATLSLSGVNALHTTYWSNPSLASNTAVATEALARVRAFWNSYAAHVASTATLTIDPVVVQLDQATGQPLAAYPGTPPAAVTFTGTGDLLPFSSQKLVKYSTGVYVRGRALVGRSFIPFGLESDSVTGTGPTAADVTALNTALGLLGTTVVTAITQGVWSRPLPGVVGSGQVEAVTARAASTKWAVQKNRRP